MKSPIVIYRGPSMLDGADIVVLASTGSSNVKTGSMVQTWIMRADLHPSEASARKVDSSVCGECPRRHSLGGDCYVQIVHAPARCGSRGAGPVTRVRIGPMSARFWRCSPMRARTAYGSDPTVTRWPFPRMCGST